MAMTDVLRKQNPDLNVVGNMKIVMFVDGGKERNPEKRTVEVTLFSVYGCTFEQAQERARLFFDDNVMLSKAECEVRWISSRRWRVA